MINVSREFSDTMRKRTDFKEYADITLADGTVLNLSASDFTVSNNYINDGAGASQIPLGVAIERNIQIEIMNDQEQYSTYDFYGAVIELYLTFQLSETVEKVVYGRFKVITPETYGETVIITAVDDMYKADKPYSTSLAFPASTGAMLREICEKCDLPLGSTTFQNSDFVVNTAPDSSYTFRAVIGFIAMIAGGNARINRLGYLEIISYDFTTMERLRAFDGGVFNPWENTVTVDGGTFNPWNAGDVADGGLFSDFEQVQILHNWKYIKIDTDDIVITGVKTVYSDDDGNELDVLEGEEGYVLEIENPLIVGKEAAAVALIGAIMIGGRYRKFEGDHISYPIAEFMDSVLITDRKNNLYQSIITDVNFTFCGLTTIKNSSESAVRNSSKYVSETIKTYIAARQLVTKERTERQKAIEQLAYQLANSSGLYITEDKQADGSGIYYMHDKPTLEESMIVWKLTALAFGISTDGGKTYPYGFTVNGETIVGLLYADGIDVKNLVVGENVTMGSKATISWKNVTGNENVANVSDIPTKISQLTNDSGFVNSSAIPTKLSQLTNDNGFITASAVPSDDEIVNLILTNRGTIITKDYIGTLKVVAGSVAAENITGTTLSGKKINGGSISIGNGNFVVAEDGIVNATGEFTTSRNIETGSIAFSKMAGTGFVVYKYADTETIDNAIECAALSGVSGEKSGALTLRKNGIRDVTIAAGSGRGVQIFDKTNGTNLVATMYRNDEWNSGAIQLFNPSSSEDPFFYVGISNANYKMKFSEWQFSTFGLDDQRLFAGGNIFLQYVNGQRKAYLDQLNVGGSAMTSLAWKWSSELGAFVLTGTQ